MPTSTNPATPPGVAGSALTGGQVVRSVGWVVRGVVARIRFLLVLGVVLAILGRWEVIRAHWLRWTSAPNVEAVTSSDTEFFCPMDPGVLSDWPSKCPVCSMSLVRRRRGEAVPLPDGVMARMQLTPYRMTLGGIETEFVDFAPLARTLDLPATVQEVSPTNARIEAEVFARQLRWIEPDQAATIMQEDGEPIPASRVVVSLRTPGTESVAWLDVAVEGPTQPLRVGERLTVRILCPVDRLEPFRSQPTSPPPLGRDELRELFVCMQHSDVVRESSGRCPRDDHPLMSRPLRGDQRIRWWCPMHPSVAADRPGLTCDACGGMVLVPRVVTFRPTGKVLSIPGSAAILDGANSYVFVDQGSGMFEARVVALGPRCEARVAVASGLEPGDRVVTQGAFLLDAETRLNPSLAAGYFGAAGATRSRHPSVPAAEKSSDESWLTAISAGDRSRAVRQKVCPVTGKKLGTMGTPVRLMVRDQVVFLCCEGCVATIEADPGKFLAKLPGERSEPRP